MKSSLDGAAAPLVALQRHDRLTLGVCVGCMLSTRRYATCPDDRYITDATCAIHDYYIKENYRAIHLVVDTSLAGGSLPVKAFVSTSSQLLLRCVGVPRLHVYTLASGCACVCTWRPLMPSLCASTMRRAVRAWSSSRR